MQKINLSYFKNVTTQTKERDNTLMEYTGLVRNGGSYLNHINAARSEFQSNGKTDLYKQLKNKLPLVTASCTTTAEGRSMKHIEKANGYIVLDIDFDSVSGFNQEIYDNVKNDSYTAIAHKSVSGVGFCVFVKINPLKFLESFRGLEKHYAETFHLEIDKSCKNVNRLRYMSYDPEIHLNEFASKFTDYIKEVKAVKNAPSIIYVEDEFSQFIQRIVDNGQPLDNDSYEGWVAVGHAIASVASGVTGLSYFDAISRLSAKYDEKQVEMKWNSCQGEGGVSIGTLYHYAQEVGVKQRYSEVMIKQITLASNHKKQAGKNATIESAIEYINAISPELVVNNEVINQVIQSDDDFSKGLTNDSEIQQIQDFIFDHFNPRINVYTEVTEVNNGLEMSDIIRNGIVIDVKNVFNGKFNVNDNDVDKVLYSTKVPRYDPIQEFLDDNKDIETDNEIQKLCDSLTLDGQSTEFKEIFLKKWLVSWFAYRSAEGYSPLTLVFSGGQNVGKTHWFRHLLPKSLREEFYTENQLTGKLEDVFSIMSKSLLIINDEFSVGTKKSSEHFKELVSKKQLTYRKPYAREVINKQRISVFAGTTNNREILVDNTGNRRILVFDIKSINREIYNSIDTDALFIEVYRLFKSDEKGFTLNAEDIEILNEQTADLERVSPEFEAIRNLFEPCSFDQGIEFRDIMKNMLSDGTFINYQIHEIKGALTKLKIIQGRNSQGKMAYPLRFTGMLH